MKNRLVEKADIISKVQKKVVDHKQSNSLFHHFGTQLSSSAEQARGLGLKYLGFGRYGSAGEVSHIVKDGKLVPVAKSHEELATGGVKYDDSHVDKDVEEFSKKITHVPLPDHDKKTIGHIDRYYKDNTKFAAINTYLNGIKDNEHTDQRMYKRVRTLDKLIAKHPLEKDTIVYSAASDLKGGGIYDTPSFRAGTTNLKKIQAAGPHVIELHLKKGARAMPVDADEVLLPRKHTIRIVGDPIKTRNHTIWKGELVNI